MGRSSKTSLKTGIAVGVRISNPGGVWGGIANRRQTCSLQFGA
jgi:hypothetical protein